MKKKSDVSGKLEDNAIQFQNDTIKFNLKNFLKLLGLGDEEEK